MMQTRLEAFVPCHGPVITHESLKKLIGMSTTIQYVRESGTKLSRSGEIANVGFRNLLVVTVHRRTFRIPVVAIIDVKIPDGTARGGEWDD
jgi:hypothetical protein